MLKYTNFCANYLKTHSTFLFNQINVLKQQSRNTFILKRTHAPPLYKKHEKRAKLTHKHFIYELIENTNCKKQPKIDVILMQTVKDVGEQGKLVSIPSTKGYETLILPKLAVYATPENIEKYITQKVTLKEESSEYSSRFVERTMCHLSQKYLCINMSLDVPWTIEKWHIRVSFRNNGFVVPEDAITLPEKTISGPDLSKEDKEFYVTVKINKCEEVKVRCKIRHYTSDIDRKIIYKLPIYETPNIAIFPEDQPILDSLTKHRLCQEKPAVDIDE